MTKGRQFSPRAPHPPTHTHKKGGERTIPTQAEQSFQSKAFSSIPVPSPPQALSSPTGIANEAGLRGESPLSPGGFTLHFRGCYFSQVVNPVQAKSFSPPPPCIQPEKGAQHTSPPKQVEERKRVPPPRQFAQKALQSLKSHPAAPIFMHQMNWRGFYKGGGGRV